MTMGTPPGHSIFPDQPGSLYDTRQAGASIFDLLSPQSIGQFSMGLMSAPTWQGGIQAGFKNLYDMRARQAQQQRMSQAFSASGISPQRQSVFDALPFAAQQEIFQKQFEPMEVNNQLVNPVTGALVGDFRTPETFTLSQGQTRFGADGGQIASVDPKPESFTLSPGQTRFEDGRQVASVAPTPPKPTFQKIGNELVRIGANGETQVVHTATKDTEYKTLGRDLVAIAPDGSAEVIATGPQNEPDVIRSLRLAGVDPKS